MYQKDTNPFFYVKSPQRFKSQLNKHAVIRPTIDELGSAGLIDTSSIDQSIFGTGKFFKEQSMSKKQNNIYKDIDEAIKKAPEDEK